MSNTEKIEENLEVDGKQYGNANEGLSESGKDNSTFDMVELMKLYAATTQGEWKEGAFNRLWCVNPDRMEDIASFNTETRTALENTNNCKFVVALYNVFPALVERIRFLENETGKAQHMANFLSSEEYGAGVRCGRVTIHPLSGSSGRVGRVFMNVALEISPPEKGVPCGTEQAS